MCTLGKVQLWVSTKQKDRHLIYPEYERTLKRTTIEIMVDMAAWFGELNVKLPLTLISRCLSRDKRPLHCRNSLLVDESIYRCIIFMDLISAQALGTLKMWNSKSLRMVQELILDSSMFFVLCLVQDYKMSLYV